MTRSERVIESYCTMPRTPQREMNRRMSALNTPMIEDKLLPSMNGVTAEDPLNKERIVLDVLYGLASALHVEENQTTIWKIVAVREQAAAGNDAAGIAGHIVDMGLAKAGLSGLIRSGIVEEGNGIGHICLSVCGEWQQEVKG